MLIILFPSRRILDDSTIEKDVVTKRANDTEFRYKVLQEEKKERNKDIRELQHEYANLAWKLQGYIQREADHKEKKAEEIASIESQRQQLLHSQVLNDRRLENEERELADKFLHHKQLSLREYNKAHHDMQKDIQSQITELTLQQKSELEHLHRHTGSKIEEMKAQNKAIIREYDALSMKIKQLSEEEELLSKTLRKEKMTSEANNTALIDWLPKANIIEGHRSNVADLEKIVNDLRQRQLEEGGQLLLVNQQKQAATKELKRVKHECVGVESDLLSLENSKKDVERRLNKRLAELTQDANHAHANAYNIHSTKKTKLESDIQHVSEEIKGLNKQITELQHEIQRNEVTTVTMCDKLNSKLDSERHHLFEIESAKRNIEIKVLILEQQHEALKASLLNLEKEVARYRAQADEVGKILSEQDDLASQLEFNVKLLESRI